MRRERSRPLWVQTRREILTPRGPWQDSVTGQQEHVDTVVGESSLRIGEADSDAQRLRVGDHHVGDGLLENRARECHVAHLRSGVFVGP